MALEDELRNISGSDQTQEAFRVIAQGVITFYEELQKSGMVEEKAFLLANTFVQAWVEGVQKK